MAIRPIPLLGLGTVTVLVPVYAACNESTKGVPPVPSLDAGTADDDDRDAASVIDASAVWSAAPSLTARSADPPRCKALLDHAAAEGKAAFARAKKTCADDDDCEIAYKGGCLYECRPGAISKASHDAMKASRERVASMCARYRESGCAPLPTATPCMPLVPYCDSGRCVADDARR